jgi:regulator of sigma E protease
MEFLSGLVLYVGSFLMILTVLVFVHEMGHFLIARKCGVRVEVFSIGFGPEIAGRTDRSGTRWKIGAVPLGGYVKMFGESAITGDSKQGEMTPEEQRRSFHHQALFRRFAIVAGGPAANYLFAVVVFTALFATAGQPFTSTEVGMVQEGGAAAHAGLREGDRIKRVDGKPVERFEELQRIVGFSPEVPLRFEIERQGETLEITIVPRVSERTDRFGNRQRMGLIGVASKGVRYVRQDPFTAAWQATKESVALSAVMLKALGQIVVGSRSAEELGGPVRIAQMSGEALQGGFASFIWFLGILSINLGLINLFPIPMLDGGHLAMYGLEAVRGKPLSPRIQEYSFRIGLTLVLMLFIFVTYQDRRIIDRVMELFGGLFN